jgi:hypothetical protein
MYMRRRLMLIGRESRPWRRADRARNLAMAAWRNVAKDKILTL